MSNQVYHAQTLTEYLLGSLPAAESERLDELSFTDEGLAEALEAAEKELVDAYVQGELEGSALERFKTYYLASPLRRERVRFAQALRVMAEKERSALVGSGQPAAAEAKQKGLGLFSALGGLLAPRPALGWASGALALLVLMAGTWLWSENVRLRREVSQTQARRDALGRREQELQKELDGQRAVSATTSQELARVRGERERLEQALRRQEAEGEQRLAELGRAARRQQASAAGGVSIASFVLAPQLRGVGQLAVVSVPADVDEVRMRLELEPSEYPAYRVALFDQSSNQTLWRSGNLKAKAAGDSKALNVRFRAGLLHRAQVYVLRVTGVSADGGSEVVGDYPFRVVK